MKAEIKTAWVAALRSGEYQQGKGALRGPSDEFCCLGVLCDLYAKATGVAWGDQDFDGNYFINGVTALPEKNVANWAGMSMSEAWGESMGGIDVVAMNDDGNSFEEIADAIEEGY